MDVNGEGGTWNAGTFSRGGSASPTPSSMFFETRFFFQITEAPFLAAMYLTTRYLSLSTTFNNSWFLPRVLRLKYLVLEVPPSILTNEMSLLVIRLQLYF